MKIEQDIKVRKLSDRVSVATSFADDKTSIKSLVILPVIEKWKLWGLALWIVLWTICGLLIISSYKIAQNSNQKIFIIVFAFFWIYYEWKMIQVFFWRKKGKEKLWIKDNKMYIEEFNGLKKKTQVFNLNDINRIEPTDFNDKSFSDFISLSFWSKGKPRIKINVLGKEHYFGYQLTDKEVSDILKEFKQFKSL